MDYDRETFERLSKLLNRCPLCGDKDVQMNTHPVIKPDANCNNCGVTYQDQTVEEVVKHWNEILPQMASSSHKNP